MNPIPVFTAIAILVATPAFAQEHADHDTHDNRAHDHQSHAHEDHGKSADGEPPAEQDAPSSNAPLHITPEIEAALNEGGEAVAVEILGVVCDFCAKAMNKTFRKREEVAAVYVDLDSKTLSIVLNPSKTLTDETIHSLVKKAGYRAASIRRGEAALKGAKHATDDS